MCVIEIVFFTFGMLMGNFGAIIDLDSAPSFYPDPFSHHWGYRQKIDLYGTWQFQRDPNDLGEQEQWYRAGYHYKHTINLPGVPQAQGYGEDNERQKHFFWDEAFWVRRTFRVPQKSSGQRFWLRIGGILPAAKIYINESYVGYTKSSRTQQRIDITDFLVMGSENRIAIKVCKLPKVRLDGMYEWMELSLMWTGIYRPISIEITDNISILDAHVLPDLDSRSVQVHLHLSADSAEDISSTFRIFDGTTEATVVNQMIPKHAREICNVIPFMDFDTWSPKNPKLYTLKISLSDPNENVVFDTVGVKFGMRKIATLGERFYLNGKPLYLRCFGDLPLYPDTLCPVADVNWYLPKLARAKAYGMNAVKGCVETMTEDFLEAADEAGLMVIQEMPFGVSDLRANRCTLDPNFMDFYSSELENMVIASRNHPSIIAYSMSSEIEFTCQTQASFDFYSNQLPQKTKKLAPNNLVIDCTGYVNTLETEKGSRYTDFYATIQPKWLKLVLDDANMVTDHQRPMILHEYNWWSSYPDPTSRDKYLSTQMKPFWLDTLVRTANQNDQGDLVALYTRNSQWLQALCIKDGLEYARRKADIQGFVFFLLIDFYRYSEGILDDFWEPKLIGAEEFFKWNADTVIVLSRDGNRCFEANTNIMIPLAVSNYSEEEYRNVKLKWKLSNCPKCLEGEIYLPRLPQGELTQLSPVEFSLPNCETAYKFDLEVSLWTEDRIINTNNWSFWSFPSVHPAVTEIISGKISGNTINSGVFIRTNEARTLKIPETATLVIADDADEELAEYMDKGGNCLLFTRGAPIEQTICYHGSISFYTLFRTVPWNGGTSGNSGTIVSYHPALDRYPHEGRCDLQFLSMIEGILPIHFEPLCKFGVHTPIIRAIDHFLSNRNNAYMIEFKVGKGNVLVTSLGVLTHCQRERTDAPWGTTKPVFSPNNGIEARFLLQNLIEYGRSSNFSPQAAVPREVFLQYFQSWKSSGNTLSNGGFESGNLLEIADDGPEEPGAWHIKGCADSNNLIPWSVTDQTFHTGKHSLRYDLNKYIQSSSLIIRNNPVQYARKSNDVIFKGYIHMENCPGATCTISISDGTTCEPSNTIKISETTGWEPFEVHWRKIGTTNLMDVLELALFVETEASRQEGDKNGSIFIDDLELTYVCDR